MTPQPGRPVRPRFDAAFMRLLLALALTHISAASAVSETPPVFGASVDAVEVDVFVTSRSKPVADLRAADFEVQDNGVRQDVSLVRLDNVGITALLVVDTSRSVRGATLTHLQEAARTFARALGDRDQAGILSFSHALRWVTPVTADQGLLGRAIDGLTAGGATAMFDALYVALSRPWGSGRPLVVVYTDGADTASWLRAESVLEAARQSSTLVDVVGPALPETEGVVTHTGGRLEDPEIARLRQIAETTGGRYWQVDSPRSLEQRFLEILAATRARYVLGYEPRGVTREGRHRIEVRVKGRKVDVRHRLEYSVPSRPPRH